MLAKRFHSVCMPHPFFSFAEVNVTDVIAADLRRLWAQLNPLSVFVSANVPGGAVQGVGQPREHAGGTSRRRAAGQELSDLQGSGCEDAAPAEMAGHRRQRPQRDQKLRKRTLLSVCLLRASSSRVPRSVCGVVRFIW